MKSRTTTSGDGNKRRSKGDGAMATSSLKHRRRTDGKRESVEGGSPTSAAASKRFAVAQLTTSLQASERERARLAKELAALKADYNRLVSAQAETASQLTGALYELKQHGVESGPIAPARSTEDEQRQGAGEGRNGDEVGLSAASTEGANARALSDKLSELQCSLRSQGWPHLERGFEERAKQSGVGPRVEDLSWFRSSLNHTWLAGWRARELAACEEANARRREIEDQVLGKATVKK